MVSLNATFRCKQVDILIYKNQVLQILCLKHHTRLAFMDKKPNEIHKNLIPKKFTVATVINSYTIINRPYNWPPFLIASCLNIGDVSSYELIRIRN